MTYKAGRSIPPGSLPDWKTHHLPLVFVHIPKNGGTAIEEAGERDGVWWPRKWPSFWKGLAMCKVMDLFLSNEHVCREVYVKFMPSVCQIQVKFM